MNRERRQVSSITCTIHTQSTVRSIQLTACTTQISSLVGFALISEDNFDCVIDLLSGWWIILGRYMDHRVVIFYCVFVMTLRNFNCLSSRSRLSHCMRRDKSHWVGVDWVTFCLSSNKKFIGCHHPKQEVKRNGCSSSRRGYSRITWTRYYRRTKRAMTGYQPLEWNRTIMLMIMKLTDADNLSLLTWMKQTT